MEQSDITYPAEFIPSHSLSNVIDEGSLARGND